MQTLSSTFTHNGRTFVAKLGATRPDWSDRRRPYAVNHVSMFAELIPMPDGNADELTWRAWRRANNTAAKPVVEAALALFGIDGSAKFSATRYCSCGCSPVWVMDAQYAPTCGQPGKGVFVNVEEVK